MNDQPNITATKDSNYFRIRFHNTEVTEWWALNEAAQKRQRYFCFRMPSGPYHVKPIETHQQFESDPLKPDQLSHHFIITRQQIEEAGWCDLRIKAHELASEIAEAGLLDFNFTDEILTEDLEKLKTAEIWRHQASLIRFVVFPYPNSHLGRRLRYHFLPWKKYLKGKLDRKATVLRAINCLIEKGHDLTRENIIREFEKHMPSVVSPGVWRSLFQKHLCVKDPREVFDAYPDWGSKLLATTLEGGRYFHNNLKLHKDYEKIGDYLKADVKLGIPVPASSIVILSDHRPIEIEEALRRLDAYKNFARRIIVTKTTDLNLLTEHHKPHKILRINSQMASSAKTDDSLIII